MIPYPSIAKFNEGFLGRECLAFYKLDGSNIRVEYSPKRGWYKWGTRTRLFDETDAEFADAIKVFHREFADGMAKKLKSKRAIAYLEFFGPHSFAGKHEPGFLGVENNDPKSLVLFDVEIEKRRMMNPWEFVKNFGEFKIPEIIYEGKLTEEFVKDVRHSKYPVNEGVVCKGGNGQHLWMTKIKTLDYLERLKEKFGLDWMRFWE